MRRLLLIALAVTVLAAAGIIANLILLGYADSRNDPVGGLSPRTRITEPTAGTSTPTTTTDEDVDTEPEEPDD